MLCRSKRLLFSRKIGLGLALLNQRQYDAAIEELRLRKEAQPSDPIIRAYLAKCYRLKRMYKESALEMADLYEVRGHKQAAAGMREAYRRGGAKAVAQWQLDSLKTDATKHYVSALHLASLYAVLQMKEQTLKSLEAAYEERAPFLVFLQTDPDYDFLHSDERYRAIVRKMGLPAAY